MPDVLEKLRDPGWTPGRKDVRPLLEALATPLDDATAEAVVRAASVVAGEAAARAALEGAPPKTRARFVALLGRIAKRDPAALPLLLAQLAVDDAASRKVAARALGKLQNARIEPALLAAYATEARPEVKRALVEALGRVGGEASRAALAAAPPDPDDALGGKMRARAEVMLARSVTRGEDDPRDAIVVPESATVVLRCREGIEELLRAELGGRAVVATAGAVRLPLRRGEGELMAARTWTAVTLPIFDGPYEGDVADAIARHLVAARATLEPWTKGRFRFRLSFRDAGHRRAVVFRVAELLASDPLFTNDPKDSPWEIEVADRRGSLALVAVAKKLPDPRFAWRVTDVPAASHPTIAAALALVGAAEEDDVVWDPFVGSALELVERARFGSYRLLVGTDLDERALGAARQNLESAAVARFRLERADARTFAPSAAPTLILTNPPMGRRVQGVALDDLFGAFLGHVADVLAPGGRFVWLTPRAKTTDPLLAQKGLRRTVRALVDMGGFAAELQRWEKPRRINRERGAR